jgi:superfamily II DNA or RNA helicase
MPPNATVTAPLATPSATQPAPLRSWQRAALVSYLRQAPRDFLAVATPGAGKTTFALRIAAELLGTGAVQAIAVVAPTEHLKTQWALAAARVGIMLDPTFRNAMGSTSEDYSGVVLTYAQVAAHPALHRARTSRRRTLVILDEVHHAGDAMSWGDAVREAFEPATRRLCLTGTPFRSDTNPIPFVRYERGPDGVTRSASDHSYGYADALRDGVVRPVMFLAYSGTATWRTRAGEEVTATLGEPLTVEQTAAAWRTALDPHGDWMPAVLEAADRRLSQVRAGGIPDAGAMVIASDHKNAKLYAEILQGITGKPPVVVLSDDPTASDKIGAFEASDERWLVAVRMVSEGVDIPRLAVGVYATSVQTPLFFAQAVGRFVRGRRRGETASVFLPSVPTLLELAGQMEAERDHALDGATKEQFLADELLAAANRSLDEDGEEEPAFTALQASAHLDRVIWDGGEYGTGAAPGSDEEEDFLGLPGLLAPDQVAVLLSQHQAKQLKAQKAAQAAAPVRAPEPVSSFRVLQGLRKELNGLVGAWHHRTGKPHGMVHAELRAACGGPASAQATAEQLQDRIETIRKWARERS